MHQSIQGKEVTFKDVLILFLKNFEKILLVALAFAVVLAAFGGYRGYRAVSGENLQKQLDDYQIALDEYNTSTQTLRDTIEQDQQRLDSLQDYTQQSIYYNLDAYNEAVSELIFYVDTGYQIVPSQYYQNPNKTSEIVSAYCDAYRSAQLYEGVNDILNEQTDVKYIDELLTIERAGDVQVKDSVGNVTVKHSDGNEGVVVIRARAQDEDTASKITSFVYDYLRDKFSTTIAEHTTTIISDSTMRMVDKELQEVQRQTEQDMSDLQENIKTNQAQLDTLERDMPQQPSFSMGSVLKKAVLYGIAGGIFGGILICAWVLLSYLADNRLDGAYQAARLYNIELLADVACQGKKRRPIFHKLIASLEGSFERRRFSDAQKAVDYADAAVRALEGSDSMTAVLVSSTGDEQVQQLMQDFAKKSDGKVQYVACPSILEDPASMEKAAKAGAVVLVERSGVTLIPQMNSAIIRLEKAGVPIVGLVLAE